MPTSVETETARGDNLHLNDNGNQIQPGQDVEENHDEELAIFSNPEAHRQPITQEQYDDSVRILTDKLPALRPTNALIEVDLNPDYPTIFIDTRQDPPKMLGSVDEKPRVKIMIRPEAIYRLDEGTMEPRYGVNMGNIVTSGSARLGMQFCDLLCPSHVQSADPKPLPPLDTLPKPVADYRQAWKDLQEFGYCLVKDALKPDQVAALKARVEEQARCEDAAGCGYHDGGPDKPNQRVWNLQNKGQLFLDHLESPVIDEFIPKILGDGFVVSSYTANIARPGGKPMFMHCDQLPVNPAIREVTLGANIAWFLDEVTEENGGTRVLVGSHKGRIAPRDMFDTSGTVAAEGPPGTALIFDSRLWHCTGANTAKEGERKCESTASPRLLVLSGC